MDMNVNWLVQALIAMGAAGVLSMLLLILGRRFLPSLRKLSAHLAQDQLLLLLGLTLAAALSYIVWLVVEPFGNGLGNDRPGGSPDPIRSGSSNFTLLHLNIERSASGSSTLGNVHALSSGWAQVAILILLSIIFAIFARRIKKDKFLRCLARWSAIVSLASGVVVGLQNTALMFKSWSDFITPGEHEDADNIFLVRRLEPNRRAIFPLFFEEQAAKLNGRWQGVTLDPRVCDESLAPLVEALAGCVEGPERAQVKLRVVGFASSARFKARGEDDDRRLNMEAANLRAASVATCLDRLIDDLAKNDHGNLLSAMEIDAHTWNTYSEMDRAKPYHDRPGASARAQELLNRSVEVQVLRAGECEPLYTTGWRRSAD